MTNTNDTSETSSMGPLPGGTWRLGDTAVPRFGYGAMQLTGPGVLGPPKSQDAALDVLRSAISLGIAHIDTSDAYGPRIANQLIRKALYPYESTLQIVTKVGAQRDHQGGWPTAREPEQLRRQVEDNRKSLDVDVLDVVNLRLGDASGPKEESLREAFETLATLQSKGVIRHLGLSNATESQIAEARAIAPIVCVQNLYNISARGDDDLIDDLAKAEIAYVPFFPLGGFQPLQGETLSRVAKRRETTTRSIALAWLLQRSPNILLIPGTSSAAHLRENLNGAATVLTQEDRAELNQV